MDESDQARIYLERALAEAGVTLKDASAMVGRNQAYIQQFLERGTPVYLPEMIRNELVRQIPSIDGDKLKPTTIRRKGAAKESYNVDHAKSKRKGKLIYDPQTLDFLNRWERLTSPQKDLIDTIVNSLIQAATATEPSKAAPSRSTDAA